MSVRELVRLLGVMFLALAVAAPVVAAVTADESQVRVGGDIKEPRKVKHVNPVYPEEAKAAGIQGIVILETIIDVEGNVKEAKILRSVPELDRAAMDAVLQWTYTPTLLNGKPVEVVMTLTVTFSLK